MSSSHCAVVGKSISYKSLLSLCPTQVLAIQNSSEFTDGDLNWGMLAEKLYQDDQDVEHFKPLVKNLQNAFAAATLTDGTCLTLELVWYDEEMAEKGDEVDHHEECIFRVEDVYQLTPAGKAFSSVLDDLSYVECS